MSAIMDCLKKGTFFCRIKYWLGMGVGTESPLAEAMIRELTTTLFSADYRVETIVSNPVSGAPKLFGEEITSEHLTPGSPVNIKTLEGFKSIAQNLLELGAFTAPAFINASLTKYIKAVVGHRKALDYTNKYLQFLGSEKETSGPEAQDKLAKMFSDGKTPSIMETELARRLANTTDIRSSTIYTFSFSNLLKGNIKTTTQGFNQQHLAAVRAAINLLEAPDTYSHVTGKTFGAFSGLSDQRPA